MNVMTGLEATSSVVQPPPAKPAKINAGKRYAPSLSDSKLE